MAQTDWYVILKGLQDDGVGFGFGAISQDDRDLEKLI